MRNSLNEEKLKESLGADNVTTVETAVQEGLDWLSANESATTEEYKSTQKMYEERIRPILMNAMGSGSGSGSSGTTTQPEPHIEEVD